MDPTVKALQLVLFREQMEGSEKTRATPRGYKAPDLGKE